MCYAPQVTCHTVGEAADTSTDDIFKTDHLMRQVRVNIMCLWFCGELSLFQTLSPRGLEVGWQVTDKSLCFMSAVWTHDMHSFTSWSTHRHVVHHMKTHILESPLWLQALALHTVQRRPDHCTDTLSVTLGHSHTYDSRLSEIMIGLLKCLSGTSLVICQILMQGM